MPDLVDERFRNLLDRHVGFELFDPNRALLLPTKTYVAIHGRYVLLGFSEQADADAFFQMSIDATLES